MWPEYLKPRDDEQQIPNQSQMPAYQPMQQQQPQQQQQFSGNNYNTNEQGGGISKFAGLLSMFL